jgi:putative ABC transport system permease protein
MSLRRHLAAGLRGLFRRSRVEQELDEELQSFLDMATERHAAAGLGRDEALRAARIEVGSFAATREKVRDAGWESVVDTVREDIRISARMLRQSPVVTLVATLSLALGTGATTALFALYDSLLLRELPVREPERLVLLSDDREYSAWSNPLWEEIRRRPQLFEDAAACDLFLTPFTVSHEGKTHAVNGLWASGRFFDVMGVPAVLGRTLRESDDRRGGGPDGPVAVVSHGFWQQRLGGAADVIGQQLSVERVPFTIVGVTPPEFFGLHVGRAFDVAIPIGTEPLILGPGSMLDERQISWLHILFRLKRGQTREAAESRLRGVEPQIREASCPAGGRDGPSRSNGPFALRTTATGESLARGSYQKPLVLVMGVAALVLLIACANIANLLLARAAARQREVGIRRALGASSARLVRLCLVESLLLAGLGAVLGLVVAAWGSRLVVSQLSSASSTFFLWMPLDWRRLGFMAAVAVASAILFGMAPAWQALRVRPAVVLGANGRALDAGGRQRLGQALVVGQVALSLALVVVAILLVRSFAMLATRAVGFDRDRVLVATADVQRSGESRDQQMATVGRIRDAVAAVPGVAAVTASWQTPATGMLWNEQLARADYPSLAEAERRVLVNYVSPGWFATYGTPLLAGRDLTDRDSTPEPAAAIVNEAFARRYLGGPSAVGSTIRIVRGADPIPLEIVGLARDSVYESLRDAMPPSMYLPFSFVPLFGVSISARVAKGSPAHLANDVEAAIRRVDPHLAVTVRSLDAQIGATLVRERLMAILSAFFGGLALLLAGLGLYGVTAYAVGRRRAEIGIRLALGAAPGSVVRLVLRRVAFLVLFGVAMGAIAGFWVARLTESLLFGLRPHDPLSFALAALVLAAAGLLAAWLPARRAARIDPAVVLRDQ